MRRDEAHLADILVAALAIQRFTSGVTLEAFKANEEKYEAVNRKLEIIGEAARRLSPAARDQFPEIPWNLLTGMRNILIHDVVWDTVLRDLPPLVIRLAAYLAANPPPIK